MTDAELRECDLCEGHGEMHEPCMGYPHITCKPWTCPKCDGQGSFDLTRDRNDDLIDHDGWAS